MQITDKDDAEDLVVTKGSLEFRNVSFRYVSRYSTRLFHRISIS